MTEKITIVTRKSPLALWQADFVKQQLQNYHLNLNVEILGMTTEGDRLLGQRLAAVGGKGLFIKELERALLDGRGDIAVHSMKDLTVELPPQMAIGAICQRHAPQDAFVSERFQSLAEMPEGSRIGSASLRRQCLLRSNFPGLQVDDLRGNVNSRLKKLDEGKFDGILLAAAGLERLGLGHRITTRLSENLFLPAVGQGAVGIEYCEKNDAVKNLLKPLNDPLTAACVTAERSMNRYLEGGCHVPIGGFAQLKNDKLLLRGMVGQPDGKRVIWAEAKAALGEAEALGLTVAKRLHAQGASEILQSVYDND